MVEYGRYRNDLCCKRKIKHDMESAAVRWGTHNGRCLYICTLCGFVHFSTDEDSKIDRAHLRAIRIQRHLKGENNMPKMIASKKRDFTKRIPCTESRMPKVFSKIAETCKTLVWISTSRISIGELISGKIDFGVGG